MKEKIYLKRFSLPKTVLLLESNGLSKILESIVECKKTMEVYSANLQAFCSFMLYNITEYSLSKGRPANNLVKLMGLASD